MAGPTLTTPLPSLTAHAISHAGRKRKQNEDAFGLFVEDRLFIVADGMGGESAGEIASALAVDELAAFFRKFHDDPRQPWPHPVDRQRSLGANLLAVGIKVAHDHIRAAAAAEPGAGGGPANGSRGSSTGLANRGPPGGPTRMACTLVALAVGDHQLSIAHAGDARAYRFREGQLTRLTTDHSVLAEMLTARPDLVESELGPLAPRKVVTRALGSKPALEPAVAIKRFHKGDCYLLCTDGLWGSVSDPEMADILRSTADLEAACALLVDAANDAGGPDNITALLVRIG